MSSNDTLSIAIIGAGGKMGTRALENLSKQPYTLHLCEKSPAGIERMAANGFSVVEAEDAVPQSDVVILAVPDKLIGTVSSSLVPLMKPDAACITLDPAAAYIGELALRDDCSFFVGHPCHPQLFYEQETQEAYKDHFGGTLAKQDIVFAMQQGTQRNLEIAREICIQMFGLVQNCYTLTVEQIALLEPAVVEVVVGGAVTAMKEAQEEIVRRGVPEEAALSFILGHIQVISAVVFGQTDFPVSDAAKVAFRIGTEYLIKPDWKRAFEPEELRKTIERMLHPA